MRTMRHVALAAMAAAGLALAGCGGGGGKKAAAPMDGDQQMEMTDAQKAQAAYDAAGTAEKAAMDARKTAEAQLAEAKKKGVYDIYSVGGDSSMVRANAKVIMDAKAAADKALADAKAALTAAEKALTDLNALPAGTTGLAAQKKVVTGQIETVKAEIKAIEKTLTGGPQTFAGLLSPVDTEAKIKNRAGETPAGGLKTSTRPARRMLHALEPADTARAGGNYDARVSAMYTETPTAAPPPTKVVLPSTSDQDHTDNTGRSMFYHRYDDGELPAGVMTWEQIAAKDGMLVKKAFGADNMDVDVLPLAGMPLSALTNSSGKALDAYPTDLSEDQYYKGVKGTLYCQGTCSAPGDKLTGKLFFKAADEFDDGYAGNYRYYWMTPRNSHYTTYHAYARYGYWLYETGSTTGVTVLANSPAGYRGDLTKNAALPATATYKGNALGLSVLKTFTAGEHTGQKSAQFTADVTLNAKFGDAGERKLGGTIDNFMGNAVDEDWSVELAETAQDDLTVYRGVTTGSRGASAHDKTGLWDSGPFNKDGIGRPAGILGVFNAHFSNGHAIGAFSTRIQAPAE